MLTIILQRGVLGSNANFLGSCANRSFKHDCNPFLPGGGLEKLQGGIKEEKYFNLNDFKLILKMREQSQRGTKLKCEVCAGDWGEYKKTPIDVHREHSCMNKHKNCMEELFFCSQEAENLRKLEQKMRQGLGSFKVRRSASPFPANMASTDLQKIPPLK